MTTVQITINPDGTGTVDLGDHTLEVTGQTPADARQQAIALVAQRASETGQPLPATAVERGRSWPLLIDPSGTVTPRTQTTPAPSAERTHALAPQGAAASGEGESTPLIRTLGGDPATATDTAHSLSPMDAWTHSPAEPDPLPASHEATDPTATAAPTQPAPTADPVDSDPRWDEIAAQPATHGWRGTLNKAGLKLAPEPAELDDRRTALRQDIAREEQERLAAEERARTEAAQESRRAARDRAAAAKDRAERDIIQTAFEHPRKVLFANFKGGQGKTTGTYGIAATAGRIRGGDVIAWDANETQGNLGFRSRKAPAARSVVDLLEEAADDFTTVEGSKRSTLARYTRQQGDNLFTVLASDEDPENQAMVDADAFERVHEILGRFYSLILIDTGNNHRVSHFKAALDAADQLVIPVAAGADGAHAAETMMASFESLGHGDLVRNAVVLLNDSATRSSDATGIAARFQDKVRAIVPIPFDPALDAGGEIDFEALQPATRAAYQEATAAIARGLVDAKEG